MFNVVAGNLIGTDVTGLLDLGNDGNGVFIEEGASANTIGGTDPNAANVIASNETNGVVVVSGTQNTIAGNDIFFNTGIGIDLIPAGVTTNDAMDADTGANDLQNFPTITNVTSDAGNTLIQGFLHSLPSTTFTLEFFVNSTCDPSGFGEGELFFGRTNVTTDAGGNATIDVTFPVTIDGGELVTSTATAPNGNSSEFSQCASVQVGGIVTACSLLPANATNDVNTIHSVTATITANGAPVIGATVNFNVIAGPKVGETDVQSTDVNGEATFSYLSNGNTGTDVITATGSVSLVNFSCEALKVWLPPNNPPTAVCTNVTTSADDDCQAVVTADEVDGGSSDPDGDPITLSLNPPGPYPLGTNNVTLIVADNRGGTNTCNATIIVEDDQAFTVTCPDDIVALTDNPGDAGVVVNYPDPTVEGSCINPFTIDCNPPSGSVFPLGTTTVTCTVTNAKAQVEMCMFDVTVFDVGLQDDATSSFLLFNSQTGAYVLEDCPSDTSLTGVVKAKDNVKFKLKDKQATHKVSAKVDANKNKGKAKVKINDPKSKIKITDSNLGDNTYSCP